MSCQPILHAEPLKGESLYFVSHFMVGPTKDFRDKVDAFQMHVNTRNHQLMGMNFGQQQQSTFLRLCIFTGALKTSRPICDFTVAAY